MQQPGPGDVRVLVGTTSDDLLDEVLRLAAGVGVEPLVVHDPDALRRFWPDASLVVVGADLAACSSAALPRRADVVLVGSDGGQQKLWQQAVALGAEHVVALPASADRLTELLVEAAEGRRSGQVAAVVGCRGGAGASALAGALGLLAVAEGLSCVLVDGDPLSGDLDLLLDVVDEPGLRWGDLSGSRGRIPAGSLAGALPARDGLALLCPGAAGPVGAREGAGWGAGQPEHLMWSGVGAAADEHTVTSVLAALSRAFDLVLVDLPRWLPDQIRPTLDLAQAAVLVTTADPRGAAGARRTAARLPVPGPTPRLVVRLPRSAVIDPHEVARLAGVPMAATMRHDSRVRGDLDSGDLVLRTSLRRAAGVVLAGLVPSPAWRTR